MESDLLDIDGSRFEGGGQILRLALGLSIIKGIPIRVYNIRAGRKSPGLAESHLSALNLMVDVGNARVEGNRKGSTIVNFWPGTVTGGNFEINCRTAGSTTLILQAVLPVIIKTQSKVLISGGTDVSFSPPTHYIQYVLQPFLSRIGINFQYEVIKYGFYPKGMGKVKITTEPSNPRSIILTENRFIQYKCHILHTLNLSNQDHSNDKFTNRYESIINEVAAELNIPRNEIEIIKVNGKDKNIIINIWAENEHVPIHNSTIENFKDNSCNIKKTFDEIKEEIRKGNCADQYFIDQIIIYLAMADSDSQIYTTELTPHILAVIELIRMFHLAEIIYENCLLTIHPL